MRVKIYGAGSIGNHLANASRQLGWNVDICDVDGAALERTRTEIYPQRYGSWDESIGLFYNDDAPRGCYDLIFIGTPPDCHMKLALQALEEGVRALLVEKPFCTPDLAGAEKLLELSRHKNTPVFVGYDHAVGKAAEQFTASVQRAEIGKWQTLDVEFREHWGGIFAAHPWLTGPKESYLAYWRRGGGATCEHSHAINLWQHFALQIGVGRVVHVQALMDFVQDNSIDYDKICMLQMRTDSGFVGRVVQDVVTKPPLKWARAQGSNGYVEWRCGYAPGVDAVFEGANQSQNEQHLFPKTRPDDFIQELKHIATALAGNPADSPLYIDRGLDTMLVIAAAFESAHSGRSVNIDYAAGYKLSALNIN
jgi:predicted dehydrogenase